MVVGPRLERTAMMKTKAHPRKGWDHGVWRKKPRMPLSLFLKLSIPRGRDTPPYHPAI